MTGSKPLLFHELRQRGLAHRRREAVIVGEVRERPDPVVLRGQHEQFLARLVRRQRGAGERLGRDDPLRKVIDAREVLRSPPRRDATGEEQGLERGLPVVVVPPRSLLADPRLEIAGDEWAVVDDPPVDLLDVVTLLLDSAPEAGPRVGAAHAPAVEVVLLGRDEAGLVHPVLEQLAVARRVVDQRARVRTEPREQRQFLAAHEHVDRVDLQQPDPVEHPPQMPPVDATGRARIAEALRRERNPLRLRVGERDGRSTIARRSHSPGVFTRVLRRDTDAVSTPARDGDHDATGVSALLDGLPRVDEHAMTIEAGVDAVWAALLDTVDTEFSRAPAAVYARVIGCREHETGGPRPLVGGSTLPGFRVATAQPGAELVLEGRHRFSAYALIFRLEPVGPSRSRLRAETRAAFAGPAGAVYRFVVIGTGGHAFAVRRLLSTVERRSRKRPHRKA